MPAGRPPSSARPGTTARPATAFGGQTQYQQHGQPSPYEIEEEYDDESDDEDVFAFLPPTTADQEEQQQHQQQHEAAMGVAGASTSSPFAYGAGGVSAAQAAASLQNQYYPQDHSSPFSHNPYGQTTTDASANTSNNPPPNPYSAPAYPDPTFDPWGRFPSGSTPASPAGVAGPSSSAGFASNNPYFAVPLTPSADSDPRPTTSTGGRAAIVASPTSQVNFSHPYGAYTRPPLPTSPPSPSTDSQPSTGYGYGKGPAAHQPHPEQYKLRRMNTGASTTGAVPEAAVVDEEEADTETSGSGPDREPAEPRRKEVRISLPVPLGTQEERARAVMVKRLSEGASSEKDLDETDEIKAGSLSGPGDIDVERAEVEGNAKSKRRRSRRSRGGTGSGAGASAPQQVMRSRNPNAQPYYAYAQHASAHGYPSAGRSSHVPPTADSSYGPSRLNTARTTALSHSHHGDPETPTTETAAHHRSSQSVRSVHSTSSYIATTKRHMDDDSLADSLSFDGVGHRSGTSRRRGDGDEEDGASEDGRSEGSIKMEFDFDAIDDEDSPFPEVRASVSNIDDPDMPAMTIRMWFVGLLLCTISSALNVFFNFRNPAPTVVPLVLLLISYPFGKFLAFTLPITTYRIPLPNLPRAMFPVHQPSFAPFRLIVNLLLPLTYPRTLEFSLNPGPWNIKEHVLVYIMANVAVGNPYALNAIVVSEIFYDLHTDYWFQLTLILATQLTGFGLAGLCRRFLVWPASMVWPQNLVACTLLNTLHAEDEDDGIGMYGGSGEPGQKSMTRYRFFVITGIASFVFFFLPGYLFQALSFFSFMCWAAPTNIPINQLFGVSSGLGMSVLTFDWTQISWIGSPLMVPWWAQVHVFVGFVLFYWILVPVLYYTNTWDLAHFPITANKPFDRFGHVYNVSQVLTKQDTFDADAYYQYSPLYLSASYAMTYMLAFALSTAVLVHTALYHGRTLINGVKRIRIEADDIHAKLMRNYPEVPDWWYAIAFCVFFSLGIVAVEVWNTDVPVYVLLLSVLLPIIYVLPSGFIYAMTGQGITLNILAQIIPGTLMPGRPIANMIFKAYSVQTLSAATCFVQDLKLGHYVKVPPRATFLAQMIATIMAAFIQVGVKVWIFNNVENICQDDQPSRLTCPHNQVFFTASAVWGLIGPTRQFGTGSLYHPHLYSIAIGAFIPIPFYLYQRRYPKSWVRYVSTPVIITGVSYIPPATGINYSSWFAVGFVFQYLIRKRNFAWWSKFNYVLSSALDAGTVVAVMVIFFALQFPGGITTPDWWGNQVFKNTADYNMTALKPLNGGGLPWKDLRTAAAAATPSP